MAIKKISHLRNSYEKGALLEKDVSEDPFVQFKKWFNLHLKSDVVEPTAMTLATASKLADLQHGQSCSKDLI